MAYTTVSNVIVPEIFLPYMQAETEVKSRLVESGAMVRDSQLDGLLAGGGLVFSGPSWRDLADTAANTSTDTAASSITPLNITTQEENMVRLSRNQAWGSADLVGALAGSDPQIAIAGRVSRYWRQQLQLATLATLAGVFGDNAANDSGDYTFDNSGTYAAGVTTFSAEAFIDALATMGDSEEDLGIVIMHSVVYNRARKDQLIEFVSDAVNPNAAKIPTFLGRRVIVDDGMPVSSTTYTTYIVGAGALRWGVGSAKVPVETYRLPLAADGGGTEALISRVEWCIHPAGHAYIGTPASGGPTNAGTSNNLAAAGSWNRVMAERKQVKLCSLKTTEA